MEKEIDRIEAMIIMGKYEIPKMVFDKVMQEGIKEGRKQLARELIDYLKFKMSGKLPSKARLGLERELQKEIKVED